MSSSIVPRCSDIKVSSFLFSSKISTSVLIYRRWYQKWYKKLYKGGAGVGSCCHLRAKGAICEDGTGWSGPNVLESWCRDVKDCRFTKFCVAWQWKQKTNVGSCTWAKTCRNLSAVFHAADYNTALSQVVMMAFSVWAFIFLMLVLIHIY